MTRPYIIGEIGSNHNGKLENALRLIDVSKNAGANAVKFQLFKHNEFKGLTKKQHQTLKQNELPPHWLKKIEKYCAKKEIELIFSVFGHNSYEMVSKLKRVNIIKIASSECINLNLLSLVARRFDKIILSTGMSLESDIVKAKETLQLFGAKKIIALHCVSNYPTKAEDMNLNYLNTLNNVGFFKVGLSDHTLGNTASLVAFGLGARYFEKHITLNKKDNGPDNFYSLMPHEFSNYVKLIMEAHKMSGQNKKIVSKNEKKYGRRKGIYAKNELKKGAIISQNDLILKQPCLGIRDVYLNTIVGKKIKNKINKNHPIYIKDIL